MYMIASRICFFVFVIKLLVLLDNFDYGDLADKVVVTMDGKYTSVYCGLG